MAEGRNVALHPDCPFELRHIGKRFPKGWNHTTRDFFGQDIFKSFPGKGTIIDTQNKDRTWERVYCM